METEAIESGADDFKDEGEVLLVITKPEDLQAVRAHFEGKQMVPESAELGYLPTQTVSLQGDDIAKFEKLKELLEDNQDVQTVWDNLA
jgi:transcriptional/translational regulatory protein YebC/TACO1